MDRFPSRFVPLTEFILRNAQWYPDRTAVCCGKDRLSWHTLNQRINRLANYLIRTGLDRGDRVALLSGNRLEYPEILFGIMKSGGVAVPLSTLLGKESIRLQLQHARPEFVLLEQSFIPFMEELSAESPEIASMHRILISGESGAWDRYSEICRSADESEPGIDLSAEDPCSVIYSSGTTGNPKGIVHTHQARLLFAMTCGLEFRVHNETVSCITTPLYSNGTQLMFLPTILMGGQIVIMPSFSPEELLELVQRHRCTHIFMVPTQFIRTMTLPDFNRFDTSSVEILLSAAAPLGKETKQQILEKFPASRLVELYGLTEGISTVLRPNEQFTKPGSVGKPRLGGDIRIIDAIGKELPRGETGEIVGLNFSMMREYYQNPDATNDTAWLDEKGKAYLKTGDIGKLDRDGYLYILDRKKDCIISGGLNIYPSDIEDIILKHPEVAEAAVVGMPHPEWGESPAAFVVKKNPGSEMSCQTLKDWANSRLASYQKLCRLEFRRSLPKNDMGKVLKKELKKGFVIP